MPGIPVRLPYQRRNDIPLLAKLDGERVSVFHAARNRRMSTLINATEVTVRYNDRAVLDAATLSVEEGQRIGLVGRNGCGKTTFLRLLAAIQAPDRGTITRRRELVVSFLAQDFMLDAALDVRMNVRQGAQYVLDLIALFEA